MSINNTVVPTPGDSVVVCHVPEYDLYNRHYQRKTVTEVWDDGQVITDDGWRTGVGSCWPSLRSIVEAVRSAEEIVYIDERMMRAAF